MSNRQSETSAPNGPAPKVLRGRPRKNLDLLSLLDYRERCKFSMKQIAQRLGVSPRTAQRRLAQHRANGGQI